MILQGNDDVAPREHVAAMSRLIPGAQRVVMPGGHGAYLGEAMAAVPGSRLPVHAIGKVMEFLDGGSKP